MFLSKRVGSAVALSLALWFGSSATTLGASDQTELVGTEIGTLTCSFDDGQEVPSDGSLPVTCDYRPVSGPIATYEGIVTRQASSGTEGLKDVFLWTVFAADSDVSVGDLSGRYSGVLDSDDSGEAEFPGSLTGGSGTTIELRPMAGEAYEKAEPAIIVLDIKLKAVKA